MTSRYRGFFDSYREGRLSGWACDNDDLDSAVALELVVDGEVVCTVDAAEFRDDLRDEGLGTGRHAFNIQVPQRFFDSAPHQLQLRIHGTDVDVPNTPKVIVFGHREAAETRVALREATATAASAPLMSLVMPTYNRCETMQRTVGALAACLRWDEVELIVVDDGSRDDTPGQLARLAGEHPNITATRIDNSGPARARNIAASMARAPLLLFVGDDVEPADRNFLDAHLTAHERFPDRGVAILGKITWPARRDAPVNFVMQHIQGDGQQQFGYKFMEPYKWYDWRLFYSSNISVKRRIVADWRQDGFDEGFSQAAFEDSELGLRLSLKQQARGSTFKLLYVPAAVLVHDHPHSVTSFMRRQVSCGLMARRFFEKHPGVAGEIGVQEINAKLREPKHEPAPPIDHYLTVFEGLKSWALIIEHDQGLGSQNWHGEFLKAVFNLAFSEGYLRTITHAEANVGAAARSILDRFVADLSQVALREVFGPVHLPRLI